MIFDRTDEEKYKVQKELEKRREEYYNEVMEAIGFMCYMYQKRGDDKRWNSKE